MKDGSKMDFMAQVTNVKLSDNAEELTHYVKICCSLCSLKKKMGGNSGEISKSGKSRKFWIS